jgi:hypothetical protein
MTYTTPHIFAILRQAYRGPCLQILTTEPVAEYSQSRRWVSLRQEPPLDTYEVLNYRNAEALRDFPLQQAGRNSLDSRIRTLQYLNRETREVQEVKYWYLPYYFRYRGMVIPLLEFQYRSWIPADYMPVPISLNIPSITDVMERIQHERLQEIRSIEDSERNPHRTPWFNDFNGYDDHDDSVSTPSYMLAAGAGRSRRALTPPPPPVPELRIVHVEVPVDRVVERVVIERRALSLPKDVGDLLLAQARGGTDSCPIAATPFSECEKLCVSSCFHIFDKQSLATWQESHTSCPVCRCKIENVVSE